MKIVRCVGYRGYECKKTIRQASNNHKYRSLCREKAYEEKRYKAWRKYSRSLKARKVRRKYHKSPNYRRALRKYLKTSKGRMTRLIAGWRRQGIIGITHKIWKRDLRKGCMFKFLNSCAGILSADHDHKTGCYRGPLCMLHNHALGKLGDSSIKLRQIARILEQAQSKNR